MSPPTRRAFLRDASLLGTTATLPWLSACGTSTSPLSGPSGAASVFRHGVASGDPLSDRVILWTRVSGVSAGSVQVRWLVGMDPDLNQVLRSGTVTTHAERDYTVKIDAEGLAPATTYYYRFEALGQSSTIGRTRTLPVGTVDHLRLAFTSCSQYEDGFFNVYRVMARRADLDAVLHLGDYIYENDGTDRLGRRPEPPREILSLEDYRARYAQYRSDPDLQEAHRQHPWICVWDDHESTNDSWKDGAQNHNEGEGDWPTRKAIATRVYHEWMPIRTPDPDDLTRIFRSFAFGDLVDLIVLETRLFGRDRPADSLAQRRVIDDPGRTMMGFEQEDWLAQQITASTARWRVYGNQTMFAQLHVLNSLLANDVINVELLDIPANPDQWDGYEGNRDRIFDQWRVQNIRNNVVITGDIHTSWANELTPSPGDLTQYGPLTGRGSMGVEFITPSVTSSGLPEIDGIADVIRLVNTHIKYVDTASHGYVLLDITPERCQGEFWYVPTIETPDDGEAFAAAFLTRDAFGDGQNGWNRLERSSSPTEPKADAPALAPAPAAAETVAP
ncbi:alkaline phosphatase D family protein [Algiphilus sp. NNCM1]|uniref:alkaline phosphatase D family protein n=1 Tax=Algiphilus sp. TaxID=1872431 RepID=UPI001CA72A01|nr:alkaline phosphatase D family protein [Algiphilus sp.]MBY8966411.1 alkaline phosphatase D family protein [Algiphilus acroporae]MCI5062842.1 alkaline phosphatase D family protein [Algiphilus sp.]MCI5103837.1 alkaline phosphatase D family protein [Algiphilus sp.]